jgi:hypothetical protein
LVGVRAQDDGSIVLTQIFCPKHQPDPHTGIYAIPILIASPVNWRGENRKVFQELIRKAFQLDRITPEKAREFFAHLEGPTPWWVQD